MEGFGYEEQSTPFNYGSVRDGMVENPSLEHKLKKQYWKTKQTVLQKLKKTEDEFVVAGDADIDAKLEKAQHLQASCQALLRALNNYVYHTKALSTHEQALGEYLTAYSETEFTQAGDVMKKAGKIYETNSSNRTQTIAPLGRLQHESYTFFNTAISDLEESINRMEKARKGYRAALLWMKDVSEKLHNPDLKDELAKFRKAQATVKESKEEFERMKQDVMEKIDMVSASRCNLLSRSLPFYQDKALAFLDGAACSFHELLTSLQNQSHHQYKMRSIAEEIRDLTLEEIGYESSASPELGKSAEDLADTKRETSDEELLGCNESLIDIIDTPRATPSKESSVPPVTESGMQTKDVEGTGFPVPNGEEGDGLNRVPGEVAELLDLLSVSQPPASEEAPAPPGGAHKLQSVMDQWDEFSSFVSSSQPNPDSGWERELSSPQDHPSSELQKEIDDMLGVIPSEPDSLPDVGDLTSAKLDEEPSKGDENALFDPLQKSASVEESKLASTTKSGLDDLTLENLLSPNQASVLQAPLLQAPKQAQTHSALVPSQVPRSITVPVRSALGADAGSFASTMATQPSQGKPLAASAKKNPNTWMNVFAHLDPLANERA